MDEAIVLVASPVGQWGVIGSSLGVSQITMPNQPLVATSGPVPRVVATAAKQLEQYFAGKGRTFDVTLAPHTATTFQQRCWETLQTIPYGEVATYADVARMVGRPLAARAVGNANHANPWPVIVPCHRVVASTSMGGYGGGVDVKQWLLELEGVRYSK